MEHDEAAKGLMFSRQNKKIRLFQPNPLLISKLGDAMQPVCGYHAEALSRPQIPRSVLISPQLQVKTNRIGGGRSLRELRQMALKDGIQLCFQEARRLAEAFAPYAAIIPGLPAITASRRAAFPTFR